MLKQVTSHLLMIRPVAFDYNVITAQNNAFQDPSAQLVPAGITQQEALLEFDEFTKRLKEAGVQVTVIEDTPIPHKPDSIFPNNWVSFHENGKVILYPIFAINRRPERREDIIEQLGQKFSISEVIDLSNYEQEGKFLESTGSMIFDRTHQIVYACYSPRTHPEVLQEFAEKIEVKVIGFTGTDRQGQEIYHTNVMMSIADEFAILCTESIADLTERQRVLQSLENTGKEVIEISFEQMEQFAGNMLGVENQKGEKILVMSEQAYLSLEEAQIKAIEQYAKILYSPLYTIERNGGGSARCMMAEIFLPLL